VIKFKLNNKEYQTPSSWKEITFQKFLDYLSEVATNEPEALKEFISDYVAFIEKTSEGKEELTEQDNLACAEYFEKTWEAMKPKDKKSCYDYFALSVGFWCGLDKDLIKDSMNRIQLESSFWAIQATLDLENLKPDETFTGFAIKGVEYTLPKKHMEDSTVSEFAETAQFQEHMQEVENGRWLSMLDVLAVLCRKRPEEEPYRYDRNRHELRKKLFRQLNVWQVMQVCFFLNRLNNILKTNLLIYGLKQMKKQKEAAKFKKFTVGR
jgi:hypothetical protein